jgi:hypothetical protein
MRPPIDYPSRTVFDLIENLHPLARIALSIVATFVTAACAILVGFLMSSGVFNG